MFSKSSLFLLMAAMAVSIVFTGCPKDNGDDDDGGSPSTVTSDKITAVVENGASLNAEVDNVEALLEGSGFVAGSGAYAGDGFTLNLAATVGAQYLEFWKAEDGVTVTVSDPQAMGNRVESFTAYQSGAPVGEFQYCNYDPNAGEVPATVAIAVYMYADRDVIITGSGQEKDGEWTNNRTYNMSLKKGWNITYGTVVTNETARTRKIMQMTGTAPEGMKWWYIPPEADFNTAVCYYWGDQYGSGTANFTLDLYHSSVPDYGLVLDCYSTLPDAGFADFALATGTYMVSKTEAAGTAYPGYIDEENYINGCFLYDERVVKQYTLITGGTLTVARSGGVYTITVDMTDEDEATGETVNDIQLTFTGPITYHSESSAGAKSAKSLTRSGRTAGSPVKARIRRAEVKLNKRITE